jgi:hypothetical protein
MRRVAALLPIVFVLACSTAPVPQAPTVPEGSVWVDHITNDLAPFWMMPDALGTPVGNFPTFRCNDGRRWEAENPCPELAEAPEWIRGELGREYTRMKSRQTFFYGAAYHLTGDPKMLELARAGAGYIRANAIDANGSAVSYWTNGVADAQPDLRTTQDLAYAQLGLAMTYYLTRDPALLDAILKLKQHIFTAYDDGSGLLLWVRDDPQGDEELRRELVSQLDQINAYMLLLAPILPEPHRTEWNRDLERLADGIVKRYWSPELRMFRGTIHDPAQSGLGMRHTDFGHSVNWKNGYHSAEHALVGYITAQEFHREPVMLWFAFDAKAGDVRPYVFSGRVSEVRRSETGTAVTFREIR